MMMDLLYCGLLIDLNSTVCNTVISLGQNVMLQTKCGFCFSKQEAATAKLFGESDNQIVTQGLEHTHNRKIIPNQTIRGIPLLYTM